MADMLQRAAAWLDAQRVAHLSRPVTYQRGGECIEIAATLATTTLEVTDEAGATVRTQQTDFIVSAGALVLGGEVAEPKLADRILVTAGDAGEKLLVYEVLALPDGRHFRPCDSSGRMLRIHAKQVDTE